jgi:Flp pilus assembly protein CpaB
MKNSKKIIVSLAAFVIAIVGVVGMSNQAQAARPEPVKQVFVYQSYQQKPQDMHRVQVIAFKDLRGMIRYSR